MSWTASAVLSWCYSVPHGRGEGTGGAGRRPDLPADPLTRGLTPRELARVLRVSPERVRAWIAKGELLAVNTASSGERPRWVILPDALAALLARRQASPPAKTVRRRRQPALIDYYPD